MPIKAKHNGSYKDITDLMNVDESIDYVLAKTSSSYKRVYTATRSIEDAPPTTFKSIKPGANLTNYRIYGNTSKNILPLSKTPKTETIGDILCEYDGKGTFKFTSNVDNPTYTQDQWFWVPFEEDFDFPVGISDGGHGCIQLNNDFATGYGVTPYFVGFANRDNGEFVSGFNVAGTALNIVDTNYYTEDLEGLPANCIAFQYLQQIGKRTVTIKPALYLDIITQQPFEPYGESVGDRTNNILPMSTTPIDTIIDDFHCEYDGMGTIKLTALTDNAVLSGFTVPLSKEFTIPLSVGQGGTGCWQMNNNVAYMNVNNSPSFTLGLRHNTDIRDYWTLNIINRLSFNYVSMGGTNINSINIQTVGGAATNIQSGQTLTISPAFVENVTVQVPFEPYGYKVPMTVEGKNLFDYDTITHGYRIQWSTGANYADETAIMSDFISVSENSTYATDTNLYWLCYDANKQYIGAWDGSDIVKSGVDTINSMTAISPCKFIRILSFRRKITPISSATMLNCGSTALPYEPYHAPITTSIYLPEPIKMVGDEAEYIEYGSQKMYRIGADDLDVTLPALPTVTGTNVLSVGTEVQPSKIDITGHIKTISGGS